MHHSTRHMHTTRDNLGLTDLRHLSAAAASLVMPVMAVLRWLSWKVYNNHQTSTKQHACKHLH
jgi:predicted negative regulator of RcsB-dependent stress response